MDIISIDPRSDQAFTESKERLAYLCSEFVKSGLYQDTTQQQQIAAPLGSNSYHNATSMSSSATSFPQTQSISTFNATWVLTRRAYVNLLRSPVHIVTRIMQLMAYAIILCACYLRIGSDQIGIQNRQGFLYECLACAFIGMLNAVAMCMS